MEKGQKEYYVYIYIDPRNFEWFYCGKGKGSRKEAHLFDQGLSEKKERIDQIRAAGLEPIIRVVAKRLTNEEALLVEKTLIWQSQGRLLNVAPGYFGDEFRPPYTLHRDLPEFDYRRQIYYFNVGDGPHRRWEDNLRFRYVGAGQGPLYRDAIQGLHDGDVVVAYLTRCGYVGVGIVLAKAKPAREFRVHGKLLIDQRVTAPKIREHLGDDERCEWMAPVKWEKWFDRSHGQFERKAGLYAPQRVRASLQNQPETIRFVERQFTVDLFALADRHLEGFDPAKNQQG